MKSNDQDQNIGDLDSGPVLIINGLNNGLTYYLVVLIVELYCT